MINNLEDRVSPYDDQIDGLSDRLDFFADRVIPYGKPVVVPGPPAPPVPKIPRKPWVFPVAHTPGAVTSLSVGSLPKSVTSLSASATPGSVTSPTVTKNPDAPVSISVESSPGSVSVQAGFTPDAVLTPTVEASPNAPSISVLAKPVAPSNVGAYIGPQSVSTIIAEHSPSSATAVTADTYEFNDAFLGYWSFDSNPTSQTDYVAVLHPSAFADDITVGNYPNGYEYEILKIRGWHDSNNDGVDDTIETDDGLIGGIEAGQMFDASDRGVVFEFIKLASTPTAEQYDLYRGSGRPPAPVVSISLENTPNPASISVESTPNVPVNITSGALPKATTSLSVTHTPNATTSVTAVPYTIPAAPSQVTALMSPATPSNIFASNVSTVPSAVSNVTAGQVPSAASNVNAASTPKRPYAIGVTGLGPKAVVGVTVGSTPSSISNISVGAFPNAVNTPTVNSSPNAPSVTAGSLPNAPSVVTVASSPSSVNSVTLATSPARPFIPIISSSITGLLPIPPSGVSAGVAAAPPSGVGAGPTTSIAPPAVQTPIVSSSPAAVQTPTVSSSPAAVQTPTVSNVSFPAPVQTPIVSSSPAAVQTPTVSSSPAAVQTPTVSSFASISAPTSIVASQRKFIGSFMSSSIAYTDVVNTATNAVKLYASGLNTIQYRICTQGYERPSTGSWSGLDPERMEFNTLANRLENTSDSAESPGGIVYNTIHTHGLNGPENGYEIENVIVNSSKELTNFDLYRTPSTSSYPFGFTGSKYLSGDHGFAYIGSDIITKYDGNNTYNLQAKGSGGPGQFTVVKPQSWVSGGYETKRNSIDYYNASWVGSSALTTTYTGNTSISSNSFNITIPAMFDNHTSDWFRVSIYFMSDSQTYRTDTLALSFKLQLTT